MRSFGTSGFLYQSNKLMYDRGTRTLWHSLTGEPVIGKLAHSGLKLDLLAVTLTTWEEWLEQNPDTTVLSLETGHRRQYLHPSDQQAAYYDYFNSPDVMFPAYLQDERLADKQRVHALRFFGAASAYPIDILAAELVVNDVVGPQEVVIVANPEAMSARTYDPMGHTFEPGTSPTQVIDEMGAAWRLTEEALVREDDASQILPRLPGHDSFWFGWYAFHPQTELYTGR